LQKKTELLIFVELQAEALASPLWKRMGKMAAGFGRHFYCPQKKGALQIEMHPIFGVYIFTDAFVQLRHRLELKA
jgi:hypothetical protein